MRFPSTRKTVQVCRAPRAAAGLAGSHRPAQPAPEAEQAQRERTLPWAARCSSPAGCQAPRHRSLVDTGLLLAHGLGSPHPSPDPRSPGTSPHNPQALGSFRTRPWGAARAFSLHRPIPSPSPQPPSRRDSSSPDRPVIPQVAWLTVTPHPSYHVCPRFTRHTQDAPTQPSSASWTRVAPPRTPLRGLVQWLGLWGWAVAGPAVTGIPELKA